MMVVSGISAGRQEQSVAFLPRGAQQTNGAAQLVRVAEVDRADAPNALGRDLCRVEAFAEGDGGEQGQFRTGVETVHVGRRIGLGVTEPLGFGEHGFKRRPVLFNLGQDVIAGAVQDAEECLDAVTADALAQGGVNRDTAADGGFHGQLDALHGGLAPDVHAVERDQFLIRRHNALAVSDGAFHHLASHAGAADQFGDDLDAGMRHDVAPVFSDEGAGDPSRQSLALRRAAANRDHIQTETELGGDLLRVFRENGQSANSYVPEAHDANIHILHKKP